MKRVTFIIGGQGSGKSCMLKAFMAFHNRIINRKLTNYITEQFGIDGFSICSEGIIMIDEFNCHASDFKFMIEQGFVCDELGKNHNISQVYITNQTPLDYKNIAPIGVEISVIELSTF